MEHDLARIWSICQFGIALKPELRLPQTSTDNAPSAQCSRNSSVMWNPNSWTSQTTVWTDFNTARLLSAFVVWQLVFHGYTVLIYVPKRIIFSNCSEKFLFISFFRCMFDRDSKFGRINNHWVKLSQFDKIPPKNGDKSPGDYCNASCRCTVCV